MHLKNKCVVQLSTKPAGHDLPSKCSLALLLFGIHFQDTNFSFSRWVSTKYYCLVSNISQKRKCSYSMAKWLQTSSKRRQTQVPAFPHHKEIQTPKRGMHIHRKIKGKCFIPLKWFDRAWYLWKLRKIENLGLWLFWHLGKKAYKKHANMLIKKIKMFYISAPQKCKKDAV